MDLMNDTKAMQRIIVSFKAKCIMDFPIDQDISNLSKEELQELLKQVYDFLEIEVLKTQVIKF